MKQLQLSAVTAQAQHIQGLARHHALRPAGPGQHQRRLCPLPVGNAGGRSNQTERLRLESVSCQHRHSLTVNLVAGGLAPAEVVVIHTGQIVVNQGIGMDQLQSAAKGNGPPPLAPHQVTESQGHYRPHPLTSGHEAVSHGLLEPAIGLVPREQTSQVFLYRRTVGIISQLKCAHI